MEGCLKEVDVGRPSPPRVVSFRRQGFLNCVIIETWSWAQVGKQGSIYTFIFYLLLLDIMELAASSSCLDFLVMMDYNLKL